jgi:uncharacterized protein YndB with AHSA1/START domain
MRGIRTTRKIELNGQHCTSLVAQDRITSTAVLCGQHSDHTSNHVRFEARGFNFSCSWIKGERMLQPAGSTPKSWVDPTRETIAMEPKQLIEVRVTRQFSVPPERIFDSWTDSKTARKWLFAAGQSRCVEIDARVGGWFYVAGQRKGQKVEYVGEYLELFRPHRLVFALLAEKYSLNFERVAVELNAYGRGCELRLTHATKPEFVQQARRDWANVLARLAAGLAQTGRNAA